MALVEEEVAAEQVAPYVYKEVPGVLNEMKFVVTKIYEPETRSLKNENVLLWCLLALALGIIMFQAWEHDKLVNSIQPQAIYEACNKGDRK